MRFLWLLLFPLLSAGDFDQRQLTNLTAFARLYGYVRHFHPSDEAAMIDWEEFAVLGVDTVRDAPDEATLKMRLEALFKPIAPTLKLYTIGSEVGEPFQPLPNDASNLMMIAWQHLGYSEGKHELMMSARSNRPSELLAHYQFGNVMQYVDATPYQGKKIRLKVSLRAEVKPPGRVQAWLRVDRGNRQMGFFENMASRPIKGGRWDTYTIEGEVAYDATNIFFGAFLNGLGRCLVDQFELTYQDDSKVWKTIPINNPSFEEQAQKDEPVSGWLCRMADFSFDYNLIKRDGPEGNYLEIVSRQTEVYLEPFERLPAPETTIDKRLTKTLGCKLLVTLYADETRTLGEDPIAFARLQEKLEAGVTVNKTAAQLSTRLATVVMLWNAFKHFYPYLDPTRHDMDALLKSALQHAFLAGNVHEHQRHLRQFTAHFGDSLASVFHPYSYNYSYLPIRLERIEGNLTVCYAADRRIQVGDILLSINGRDAEQWVDNLTTQFGGDRQNAERMALKRMLEGPLKNNSTLTLLREGRQRTVTLTFEPENPPSKSAHFTALDEGVYLIDLGKWGRAVKPDEHFDKLKDARAIIFDTRGSVTKIEELIAHLIDQSVAMPPHLVPQVLLPDQEAVTWKKTDWRVEPKAPKFGGRYYFISDQDTFGKGEILLSVVSAHHLGEIVGFPSAGSPGEQALINMPGGFKAVYSAVRVEIPGFIFGKGAQPTVPLTAQDLLTGGNDPALAKVKSLLKLKK